MGRIIPGRSQTGNRAPVKGNQIPLEHTQSYKQMTVPRSYMELLCHTGRAVYRHRQEYLAMPFYLCRKSWICSSPWYGEGIGRTLNSPEPGVAELHGIFIMPIRPIHRMITSFRNAHVPSLHSFSSTIDAGWSRQNMELTGTSPGPWLSYNGYREGPRKWFRKPGNGWGAGDKPLEACALLWISMLHTRGLPQTGQWSVFHSEKTASARDRSFV